MGEIDVALHREFTMAIGLGDGHHAALSEMMQALATPYEEHCQRFLEQWMRATDAEGAGDGVGDDGRLSRISHNVILTHEDKTFSGAFIASASIPWGASEGRRRPGRIPPGVDAGHGAVGDARCWRADERRRRCGRWCTWPARSMPDGSFAQNFWMDGTPYWTGIQLDEVAFPIMLAWRLWKRGALEKFDVFPFVETGGGLPGAVCADYAAGAVGGERGLFALDAGGGDCGAGVRGGPGAGA